MADVLRQARFKVRKQKFKEECKSANPLTALSYLQSHVAETVDHNDEAESRDFRELAGHLFAWKANSETLSPRSIPGAESSGNTLLIIDLFSGRTELYESLLEYFPQSMREPKNNLIDLVPMV